MAKKNPAKTQATRKAIMDSYWKLFEQDQTSRISVSAIVSDAHINRSTFYEYFQNVDEVRSTIENEILTYLKEKAALILSDKNAWEEPEKVAIEILHEKGRYISLLYSCQAGSSFVAQVKSQLETLLIGTLKPTTNLDTYRIEFVLSGMLATYTLWFKRKMDIPLESLAQQLKIMIRDALELSDDVPDTIN